MNLAILFAAPVTAIPVFIRFGRYRAVISTCPSGASGPILQAMIMAILLWVVLIFLAELGA